MMLSFNYVIIILSVILVGTIICCIRQIEYNADNDDDNSITELLV